MPIVLILKTPGEESVELPIFNKTILGRSTSADVQIKDQKVSGKHCSFELTNKGEILFTDLGSTNGSYLNNSAISKTIFKINDQIKIGDTTIKILASQLTIQEKKLIGMSNASFEPGLTIPEYDSKKDR